MTVKELKQLIGARNAVEGTDESREVRCGYVCDLLSWVMAHGAQGMAWTTVQTHVNVVAVAVLMEMACVILPEGNQPEPASLQKATDEGLAMLTTDKTAYEVCGLMMRAGVLPSVK